MDCSNTRSKPPSTGPLLYKQVQEQSSLCDVIIKVELWEKRFHWCVLAASPFFENIYRNNFLEKQTGIIELNKWPASLVEHSLMFLYGRKPNVTEANVDTLLDIAEFLLIPELKVACVEFLKRTKVTVENCMKLLELSCVYGMELETCESFIRGHLPEVLEQEGMLNVTTESLNMLLTDPTLSYVSVQKWFNFLIRWAQYDSERQCNFVELFHMLDFGDCDSDFINNIVAKEPSMMKNKEELEKTLPTGIDDHDDTVLIFGNNNDHSLMCLNWRTMLWHRIDIAIESDIEDARQFRNTPISGVKNSISSCIYKASQRFNSFSVLTHDLSNAHSSVSNVVLSDTGDNARRSDLDHYSLANDRLVAVFNKIEQNTKNKTNIVRQFDSAVPFLVQRTMREGGMAVNDIEHIVRAVLQQSRPDCNIITMWTSTLYIGKLTGPDTEMTGPDTEMTGPDTEMTGPDTEMHAILTLPNHSVSEICCDDNGTIAMLSSDRDSLFIFNEPTGELECIQLKTTFGIEISYQGHLTSFRNGFVLHDMDKMVCISKPNGACLETKYHVKQLTWEEHDASHEQKYVFGGDRLFRFTYNRCESDDASLEYINHDDLTTIEDTALLPWKSIALPSEPERVYGDCKDVFAVSLPKGTARCHLDCPHCKLTQDDQPRQNTDDDWDDYYHYTVDSSVDDVFDDYGGYSDGSYSD